MGKDVPAPAGSITERSSAGVTGFVLRAGASYPCYELFELVCLSATGALGSVRGAAMGAAVTGFSCAGGAVFLHPPTADGAAVGAGLGFILGIVALLLA